MPFSDDEVFELTKIFYKEIYENFSENYIGEKQPLEQFQQNYVQPLYPLNKIQQQNPPDQTLRGKISQYRHKYESEIVFDESEQSVQSEDNDSSKISYVSGVQKYSIGDLICKLRLGRFFCWNTNPPDHVYQDLGLGICLYLKFMKHLVWVLLLLTVLSAISMSLFYSIAKSNKYNPGLNYQKILFSLGVGSLSLEGIKCIHENITANAVEFDLVCPVGMVRVLGPVYAESMFQTLQTCKKDVFAFIQQTPQLYLHPHQYNFVTNCNEQLPNCSYNITVPSPNSSYQQVSVTYQCINGKNTYGAVEITRNAALYVSVILDLIMIISLMLFFWSESSAQKKEQKYFKQKQILLNAFTLEISSFSKRNFNQQFINFIEDLQRQIKKDDNLQLNLRKCIIQVRLPDNDQYDHDQEKRQDAYREIYSFIGEHFIQKQIDPTTFPTSQQFKSTAFPSQKQFLSYRRKLAQKIKYYRQTQKLKGRNHDQQLKIYVVFLKPKYKRLIMQKTKIILGKQILQTQKKDYEIIDPPAPSLILWDNIGKNKLARGIASWILTVVILIGVYITTAYVLNLQNDSYTSQYDFNIQCQNVFPNENYNQFNQIYYQQYKLSYTVCYCSNRSFLFSFNFEQVCADWREQYTLFLTIPVLYGFGLFVMNEIVSMIFRKLSQLEAHEYLTSELYSYIIKQTILQTTDLALVIVLLSIDFNKKSSTFDFLLIGSYDDISADWHLQVGIIIIVNMFFNMFSPFVQGVFYIGEIIQHKLKLCFFHKRSTYNKTKMNYIQHFRENVFPIEERYASILAVMFISLALNCVYPIMTVIMAVSLLLFLLMDKLMIIKAYNKPLNFQGLLQKQIMNVFLVFLLLHIIITAIFLTQPFLIVAGRTSGQASIMDVTQSRVANMFKIGYVLPYMILFVIIVIFVVVIYVSDRYLLTKPNPRVRLGLGGIPFEENKFYNLLDAYELDRTIALKRRQIQRNKILQMKYMRKITPQQQQTIINNSLKPFIPTRRRDLILNASKPILSEISQYSYYRLLKKKLKTSKQQQKLIKLAGMTAYEWQQDWIYFDQQVRLDYKIPEVDSYLNKLAKQADNRVQLIKTIIEMARNKKLIQAKDKQQIKQVHQEIKQEQNFEQIINDSHVTSVQHIEDNPLEITDTVLPILELERQVEEMMKNKDKEQRLSRRNSNLSAAAMRREVQNHSNKDKQEAKKQNISRSQKRSNKSQISNKNDEIDMRQIIINVGGNRNSTSNQLRRTSTKTNLLINKRPSFRSDRDSKKLFIQQPQKSQHAIINDIQNLQIEQSQQINTSEQQDNENEKNLNPHQLTNPDISVHDEEVRMVVGEQQQGVDNNKDNDNRFEMNEFPSENVIIDKDNDQHRSQSE